MIGRTVIVTAYHRADETVRRVSVHVTIDDDKIIEQIARRAARNRTGKSTAQDGQIRAHVIVASTPQQLTPLRLRPNAEHLAVVDAKTPDSRRH